MQGVVKPWVDDCVTNHRGCREVQQLGFTNCAPTRLIDVGTTNDKTVKLVDTGGLSDPQYLILSYCWGTSNDKSKTTQANIKQRRESIQIAAFPKAIRDAIAVTRHMGVQYLWVDAICIIQENKEINDGFLDDWKIEAAKMASYYSNAMCCISNLSATDSSEGFLQGFLRKDNMKAGLPKWGEQRTFGLNTCNLRHEAEEFIQRGRKHTINLPKPIRDWDTEWKNSPLMRRAWALQEWILSRRILHCTKDGMFMECGKGVCQPNDPFTKPVAAWHHTLNNELSNILRESSKAKIGNLWTKLVTFYSTMNLTHPTDRLVAIDGIARLICAKYNTGYFAGVLSSHVAETLLWRRRRMAGEEDFVSFPSWSWSCTMNIEFPEHNTYESYVRCIDDDCFLLSDEVVNYADPSTRLFPLRGPVLPYPTDSYPQKPWRVPETYYNVCYSYVSNGPLKHQRIRIHIDSTKECLKLEQCASDKEKEQLLGEWRLLFCSRGFTRQPFQIHCVEYYGVLVENLKDLGTNAYRRIGYFEAAVRSEEPDLNLEEWMTDINLF